VLRSALFSYTYNAVKFLSLLLIILHILATGPQSRCHWGNDKNPNRWISSMSVTLLSWDNLCSTCNWTSRRIAAKQVSGSCLLDKKWDILYLINCKMRSLLFLGFTQSRMLVSYWCFRTACHYKMKLYRDIYFITCLYAFDIILCHQCNFIFSICL